MSSNARYKRIGSIRSVDEFRRYAAQVGAAVPMDDRVLTATEGSPLGRPMRVGSFIVGNRWAIQPMEGWDGTRDGRPTEATFRRWARFGRSGAKLIWGGEAFAVTPEGRANPNQLCFTPGDPRSLDVLHRTLIDAHRERFGPGADGDLLAGLQLTHSGRYSKPGDNAAPRIVYHHPLLDRRVGIAADDGGPVLDDGELEAIAEKFVACAKAAHEAGFRFVDVKHCHGYLGHELLSAYGRPGRFGGDLYNRARFLRIVTEGIRAGCPGMMIGVRLSLFDTPPFRPGPDGVGVVEDGPYAPFGARADDPLTPDLSEPIRFLTLLRDELKVELVNLTAGSPYYNPHIQRPAYYPPSDGYLPPEDPLLGCARQLDAVRQVRLAVPGLPLVGSAYSYLQEYLPHVAQAAVGEGWTDFVGLGRMVLSYEDLPADVLEGHHFQGKKLCRTFSDCTTAPRHGLPSGCYPLDPYYKSSPQAVELKIVKRGSSGAQAPTSAW